MSDFWLGILGAFLGSTLAVIGTDFMSFGLEPGKRLEKRRDEHLQRMLSMVDEIERLGSKYWNGEFPSNSNEIRSAEQTINAGFLTLSREISDLFWDHIEHRKACDIELRALRSAMTGGNFGDSQELSNSIAVVETKTKSYDLKRAIRKNRDRLPRRFL